MVEEREKRKRRRKRREGCEVKHGIMGLWFVVVRNGIRFGVVLVLVWVWVCVCVFSYGCPRASGFAGKSRGRE